jgi:hypothetical protein
MRFYLTTFCDGTAAFETSRSRNLDRAVAGEYILGPFKITCAEEPDPEIGGVRTRGSGEAGVCLMAMLAAEAIFNIYHNIHYANS